MNVVSHQPAMNSNEDDKSTTHIISRRQAENCDKCNLQFQ